MLMAHDFFLVDVTHVVRKWVRMHRDFGVRVSAEKRDPLDADGPVAKCCAFCADGNDADVLCHVSPPVVSFCAASAPLQARRVSDAIPWFASQRT